MFMELTTYIETPVLGIHHQGCRRLVQWRVVHDTAYFCVTQSLEKHMPLITPTSKTPHQSTSNTWLSQHNRSSNSLNLHCHFWRNCLTHKSVSVWKSIGNLWTTQKTQYLASVSKWFGEHIYCIRWLTVRIVQHWSQVFLTDSSCVLTMFSCILTAISWAYWEDCAALVGESGSSIDHGAYTVPMAGNSWTSTEPSPEVSAGAGA